ncbi:MAG TPA: HAD family hydrolase [Anaerolineales bacterium]|nr:HAD family hydrolase [Anaerolineales bacterium]
MGSPAPRRFKAVLFDLGSTLMYFDGPWPQVIQQGYTALFHVLTKSGLSLEQETFLALFGQRLGKYYQERDTEFIEYTTAYILRTLLAELGFNDIHPQVIRQALDSMYKVSQAYWKPEDEALPTLQALRGAGYRMGLISNAADDADVQALVDSAGIRAYFEVILTSAAQGIRKPNPRIFHQALEHMNLTPDQAVMVGDTLGADILGAEHAGIFSIWITRRADTPGNQAHLDTINPRAVIGTLSELPDLLAKLQE